MEKKRVYAVLPVEEEIIKTERVGEKLIAITKKSRWELVHTNNSNKPFKWKKYKKFRQGNTQ